MKRVFDLMVSIIVLAMFFVPMVLVGILVRYHLGTPVLFRQIRPGLGGKPFQMIKFRTMRDLRDSQGKLLPDSDRLTKFGRFLRASSLDELPEVWNVLKGDMSLVGPRPLLMDYLSLYTPAQFRRHEVRPGITGWAQVNGRNALTWEERFEMDIWYVDNRSFVLDMKILWMTIWKVLRSEGVSQAGQATMEKFRGKD